MCLIHNFEWITKYAHLKSGHSRCKLCAWNIDCYSVVESKIKALGYILKQWMVKRKDSRRLLLECPKHNHSWRTSWNDIKKNDHICYYCARETRKTPYKKIKALVELKDGTLITTDCIGSTTRIKIRCNKDQNEWETCYDNINQGYWCPKCGWIKQAQLHDIIKDLFPGKEVQYNARPFDWLKTTKQNKQRLQIDI